VPHRSLPSFPPRRSSDLGVYLLDAVQAPTTPPGLQQLAIITTLRQTWQRHYEWTTDQAGHTHVRVKPDKELGRASESIESPYDRSEEHTSELQSLAYLVC